MAEQGIGDRIQRETQHTRERPVGVDGEEEGVLYMTVVGRPES
jgi:hypothetical protein